MVLRVRVPLKMFKSLLFGLLLCSVAAALEDDPCETTTMPPKLLMKRKDDLSTPTGVKENDLKLGLKELFMKANVNEFTDETSRQLRFEFDSLDHEAMGTMFRSVDVGSLPEYVQGKGFELIKNHTGQYAFSTGNQGVDHKLIYGKLDKKGHGGNYTSIAFNSLEGKIQQKTYKTGSTFYGRVQYVKDDFSVQWTAFTNGIFILRLPNNKYYIQGTYGGYTNGEVKLLKGPKLEFSGVTLGATDTLQLSAKSVTNLSGTSTLTNSTFAFDMATLTGGTNATMKCHIKLDPESQDTTTTWNGSISRQGHNISVNYQAKGQVLTDKDVLFSDTNLKNIFHLFYSSIGLEMVN